ncbi:hypothetical protein AB0M22_21760 [Nocardia sp. NPDC051756]|uniref:hypothetical protein n=1 Tax=Nocardia sp. NPDC051756 TaxID=3154751 RepID=UPI00342F4FBE
MNTTVAPPRFVLWQEVLFAYLAPAVCAGAGGLVTGRADLLLAAVTSIAGTSALVALLLGMWLRYGGIRIHRVRRASSVFRATAFGLGAAAGAAVVAQILTTTTSLPDRIQLDFPVAAALAATITTWRWCAVQRKVHA